MPTTYDTATDDVFEIVNRILKQHHPDLAETQCKIGVIFASNEDGPAIKVHGSAALACIQVVSAKRRPHCEYDAEITIDASEWNNKLIPAQHDALINHELHHLVRVEHSEKKLAALRKEDPDAVAWKIDSLGRPKLKTIPADITPGDIFLSCVAIHGRNAIEFHGIKIAWDACEEVVVKTAEK